MAQNTKKLGRRKREARGNEAGGRQVLKKRGGRPDLCQRISMGGGGTGREVVGGSTPVGKSVEFGMVWGKKLRQPSNVPV